MPRARFKTSSHPHPRLCSCSRSGILRQKKWNFPIAGRFKAFALRTTGEMTNTRNIPAFFKASQNPCEVGCGGSWDPLWNQLEFQANFGCRKGGKRPKLPGIVRRNTPRAYKVIFFFPREKKFFFYWSSVAKCVLKQTEEHWEFPEEQIPVGMRARNSGIPSARCTRVQHNPGKIHSLKKKRWNLQSGGDSGMGTERNSQPLEFQRPHPPGSAESWVLQGDFGFRVK